MKPFDLSKIPKGKKGPQPEAKWIIMQIKTLNLHNYAKYPESESEPGYGCGQRARNNPKEVKTNKLLKSKI